MGPSRPNRIPHVRADDCWPRYEAEKSRVAGIVGGDQRSWYSVADGSLRLAKMANALARPSSECREWLRLSANAYREVFARRGSTISRRTLYRDGKPLPEEVIVEDGYTSHDSMQAAYAALSLGDLELARELAVLAGSTPSADWVAPNSTVCTTNVQTISQALNALLATHEDVACREAGKLAVRRATKTEKQLARMLLAIAGDGDSDFVSERDVLLEMHAKEASRPANQFDCGFWLCLPAVALSFLAFRLGRCKSTDLATDNPYCPVTLWAAELKR